MNKYLFSLAILLMASPCMYMRGADSVEAIVPPFSEDFSDRTSSLDKFTVINLNNDENTWIVDSDFHAHVEFNPSKAMNDWLITPPLHLEAGLRYPMEFSVACALEAYPERIGVYLGTEPTSKAMTTVLIEPFDIANKSFMVHTVDITVNTTGDYYVGFHGCSSPDRATLFLDDIHVSAGVTMKSPGAATGLKAVADRSGGLSAEIFFTTPSETLNGEPLSTLDYVVVERDGQEIERYVDPGMGVEMTCRDNNPSEGVHTYEVRGYNADGAGLSAKASTYVGVNIPGQVENVALAEPDLDGMVTLSWSPATLDWQGYPLNKSDITYTIYSIGGVPLIEGLTETEVSFRAIAADSGQSQIKYFVGAVNKAGVMMFLDCASCPWTIVGSPSPMPYGDSFADASTAWDLTIPSGSGGQWQITGIDPGAQDDDHCYAEFAPTQPGDSFILVSQKVRLSDPDPLFSFYYYSVPCENVLKVTVRSLDGEAAPTEVLYPLAEGSGWTEGCIDLRKYSGKTVQYIFSYEAGDGLAGHVLLDNVTIRSGQLHNMAVTSIHVPEKMHIGEEQNVSVGLRNAGMDKADGYKVTLYRDGEAVATVNGEAMEPFATATLHFKDVPTLFCSDSPVYRAEVEWGADADASDNQSAEAQTIVVKPSFPTVSDLSAEVTESGIRLTWSAIDFSTAVPEPVTEDFESYDSFTIDDFGQWMPVDVDGRGTYGLGIDNMPHAGDPFAYILVDNTNFSDDPNFSSRGIGSNKYLASVCCAGEHNDDWIISPMLCGEAQEVSLWARRRGSSNNYVKESFEILYSSGSLELEDFVLAEAFDGIPYEWTRYAVQLPAGSRYFAVRCTSPDQFALFIDDITYTPAAMSEQLSVIGYNIYRDGVRINSEPVVLPEYADTDIAADTEHTYHVTAVYDKGESRISNGVSVNMTGIETIGGGDNAIRVETSGGMLIVRNAAGLDVIVVAPDGRVVSSFSGEDYSAVQLAPGMYIVCVGSVSAKVVMR
ncbi:MAG: hypothetical protein HDS68_03470 [Bacteroidales bacterium]|nr:hypothetical protein [Bacteroidales bacterium]